ncbi:diacylglycerol kinase family protein [bacterium]|nr:diacylglycerol kinase family protein [bacterium]
MSKFKSQGFNKTFRNARKGLMLVIKSEINIRFHLIIAFFVLLLAGFLRFSYVEFCLLLFAIAIVIISEMLNTAIEFTLDSIYHNKYSRMVGMAKDISAGAVMLASFVSAFVGIIIFGRHLFF